MAAARVPPDEDERLATLASYRILDTPPDQRIDQLVALAAEALGAPIAALTLVDTDRVWMKSRVGIDGDQIPRADAFCADTILRPGHLLVVEDLSQDRRFRNNKLVTGEAHMRFYAGMPVIAPNRQPLGALCVMDSQPRRLRDDKRRLLCRLAVQAGALLELHWQTDIMQWADTRDTLTGLPNRRWFENLLAAAMEGALAGLPCGVIVLDLDHFRAINDRLGQDAGDAVLREVTRRLQDCVRGSDRLARLGGDEFGVLVSGPVDLADVTLVARRIEAALRDTLRFGATEAPLRASIGLAVAPVHGLDAPSLLRAAAQALFAAKGAGRQSIRVADHGAAGGAAAPARLLDLPPGTRAAGHLAMQTELDAALRADALHFHWQPIFHAGTCMCAGYEALLRWNRRGHGPVPPSVFIPVAEETGLIGRLDAWVLEHACAAAAAWPDQLPVSVNMSAHWFGRPDLNRLLRGVLARSGLSPARLIIEMTERTLVQHAETTLECLNGLRAMGVRLALDDFGIGYSSFGYLRRFAFDKLKLDRDFVRPLGEEPRAELIARSIVELGHSMNMRVCGEGVETAAQLASLQAMGCDYVQGFYLGRPVAMVPSSAAADDAASVVTVA